MRSEDSEGGRRGHASAAPELARLRLMVLVGVALAVALVSVQTGPGIARTADHLATAFVHFVVFTLLLAAAVLRGPLRRRPRGGWNWMRAGLLLALLAAAGTIIADLLCVLLRLPFGTLSLTVIAVHFAAGFGPCAIIVAFYWLEEGFFAARLAAAESELERERAVRLAESARLASLESRLHPHFLFNTLASLRELVRQDPLQAEAAIERLGALLRFSLDSERRGVVSMEEELRIVADYLEIERVRLGSRLRFSIDCPEALKSWTVPALAVHTLVENCIKHAIAPRRAGGSIAVRAAMAGGRLAVEVSDDGPGFQNDALLRGHALEVLSQRLDALYAGDAELSIARAKAGASVCLMIPPAARRCAP